MNEYKDPFNLKADDSKDFLSMDEFGSDVGSKRPEKK